VERKNNSNVDTVFSLKCPRCSSKDVEVASTFSLQLYTVKPNICKSCGMQFEFSNISKIALWLMLVSFSLLVVYSDFLDSVMGRSGVKLTIYIWGALVILLPLIGFIVEKYKPWQYVPYKKIDIRKKLFNYGMESSLFVFGIFAFVELINTTN